MPKDNPLGFTPAQLAAMERDAETRRRVEREAEARARGFAPTTADVEREIAPDAYAAKELARRGVEALRPLRSLMIAGASYTPADLLLVWPRKMPPGFIRPADLAGLCPDDYAREGDCLTFREAVAVRGVRFKVGEVAHVWPETPLRGFLGAREALELLTAGDLVPVALEPADAAQ